MATPIRWKQSGRVGRYGANRPETPLRSLALNLAQAARSALAEPYMLTVEHRPIYLRRLPEAFQSLRVVQISDVHHSAFTTAARAESRSGMARGNWSPSQRRRRRAERRAVSTSPYAIWPPLTWCGRKAL